MIRDARRSVKAVDSMKGKNFQTGYYPHTQGQAASKRGICLPQKGVVSVDPQLNQIFKAWCPARRICTSDHVS